MRLKLLVFFSAYAVILVCINPVYAFMGDYKSETGNDMAVIGGFKSIEISYEDDDGDLGEREAKRQTLFAGVSKTINSTLKVFGGINYVVNGEINYRDLESDGGYSITAGAGYTFVDQPNFSVAGFGQLNYIIADDWEADGFTLSLNGYELLGGVTGNYLFNPNFSAFATAKIMPISDLTLEVETGRYLERDVKREDMLGIQAGVMYDGGPWFVKGFFDTGMESGFGLSGGFKF